MLQIISALEYLIMSIFCLEDLTLSKIQPNYITWITWQLQVLLLYFLEDLLNHLLSLAKVPYAMHGYGGYFVTGILDRFYRSDMSVEEGVGLLKKCIAEVQKRLVVNLPAFKVQVVNKDGIRNLDDITVKPEALGI